MKRTRKFNQEITIEWWRDDSAPIQESHLVALEEKGFDRAKEMIAEGYVEGELIDNIHMVNEEDPEDGIDYSGWWTSTTSNSID